MTLLTITDPERILAEAEDGPQGLPLVRLPNTGSDRQLLKFKRIYGCCEALGYFLASQLRVPLMRAVPVWCPRTFRYRGEPTGEGRIGLAVQYVDEFRQITREEAALRAPEVVAGGLALYLLDRDEWGDFAVTPYGLVFYDLERLFPFFCPERSTDQTWDDVADKLEEVADAYCRVAPLLVGKVVDEATKLGLTELFRDVVYKASRVSSEEWTHLFDLRPHPLAKQIADIAARVVTRQFRYAFGVLSS